MNLQQAADYLDRDPTEVRKMAAQGIIPGYQEGIRREWVFLDEDLIEWAAANPKQSHVLSISDNDLIRMCKDRSYDAVAAELGVTATDISYHMRRLGYRRYNKGG